MPKQTPLPVSGDCLCVSNQWAYSNNCVDAVNRLLLVMAMGDCSEWNSQATGQVGNSETGQPEDQEDDDDDEEEE